MTKEQIYFQKWLKLHIGKSAQFINTLWSYQDRVKPAVYESMQAYADQQSQHHAAKVEDTWVSVEDRLPEYSEKVLICLYSDSILMGELKIDKANNNIWFGFFMVMYTTCVPGSVTHWMPLPSLPLIATDALREEGEK